MKTTRYIDTRGKSQNPIEFSEAVLDGIAANGGLYVPESLPKLSLDQILSLAEMPYWKQAAFIYEQFGVDFSSAELEELMQLAYGSNFDTEEVCPIHSINKQMHFLELWHGPTSAFKDMALQCLPVFFSASAKRQKEAGKLENDFMIFVATSGDTGKAALEGFKNKDGVKIAVVYPHGGVSDIQHKQMATQDGKGTMVWAVRGNFDDCQNAAKACFANVNFAKKLEESYNTLLSSANSINWGRLLPQVVYYVSAYARMVAQEKLFPGDALDVCVPTGNFGNILAAWYAKQIGTPIGQLICASNENHVLSDFINTGTYDISNREFILTPSPSMDILISSNLERLLFEITQKDSGKINEWMLSLKKDKKFKVDIETFKRIRQEFTCGWASSQECFNAINEVFKKHNYLIDPHTAVAYECATRTSLDNPVLIASTAHWAKFGDAVYKAIEGISPASPLPAELEKLTGCELNQEIVKKTGLDFIPSNLLGLDDREIVFSRVINSNEEDIEGAIESFLASRND